MMPIETVILPVAGQGTRLLPLTKAVPKELLPVYDRPVLQFAIDEAVEAGARQVVVVTHRRKPAIAEYLTSHDRQVARLKARHKTDLAAALSETSVPATVDVQIVEQDEPLGLGHAVLCAEPFVSTNPVAVILPDDCILGTPCLPEMAVAYRQGHMIAAQTIALDQVHKYGIFDPVEAAHLSVCRARGIVEKPDPKDAPSQLAAVGRYILDTAVFDSLRNIGTGAGGEIQLTDAIAASLETFPLTAFRFSGTRYDCGALDGLNAAGLARKRDVTGADMAVAAE